MESILMPSAHIWMPDAPLLAGPVWPSAKEILRSIAGAMGGRKAVVLVDRWFAMSDAGASQTQLLRYQNTNYSQAPIIQGSSSAGSYFIALHNSTGPGHAGTQSTNESIYTNYARQAVARSSGGWTAGGSTDPVAMTNAAAITYPACGATGDTLTAFSIGSLTSGAGVQYIYANLTSNLTIASGVTPSFAIAALSDTLT